MDAISRESVQKLIDESNSLSILFTGKTGVGKSSLANALVGSEVSPEGESLDPKTLEVTSLTTKIEGVDVTIWDSPGLQDGTRNEAQYLENMAEKCKELDLVLYCSRMDDTRIRQEDHQAIQTLTKAFGETIWNNAVFTLTFANMVKQRVRGRELTPHEQQKYFELRHSQWETKLREAVEKSGVSHSIASTIPVVPVGYITDLNLPSCKNWLKEFWLTCLKRINKRAKLALIKSNLQRLKPRSADDSTSQSDVDLDVSLEELNDVFKVLVGGTSGFFIGSAVGAIGGPVGFVIGGALGLVCSTVVAGTHVIAENITKEKQEQEMSKKMQKIEEKRD